MTYDELQRVAMSFILESETWPVFLSWCGTCPHSDDMVRWLKTASLTELRREWMRRSDNPRVVAMADLL